MKPLDGIKIIDFTTLLPGPLATLMLSDAGAEVIKVEKVGGEDMRKAEPLLQGESFLFALLNRGKKSIEVDLKNKFYYHKLLELIKKSDVIIEQFRPGVMKRLGLDWQSVKKINKKIVYCSITGFGQNGVKSKKAAHDINYMAESGLLSLSTSKDGIPLIPSTQIADIAGGTYPAFMNVLLGIIKAIKTGKGSYIDVSMYENLIPLAWLGISKLLFSGTVPVRNSMHLNGGTARYNIYQTKDKKYIALGALEDKFWINFCRIIKAPVDVEREEHSNKVLIKKIQSIIKEKNSIFWRKKLDNEDNVCCTVLKDIGEFFNDLHIKEKGFFENKIKIGEKKFTSIPTALNKNFSRARKIARVPLLGENNDLLGF